VWHVDPKLNAGPADPHEARKLQAEEHQVRADRRSCFVHVNVAKLGKF